MHHWIHKNVAIYDSYKEYLLLLLSLLSLLFLYELWIPFDVDNKNNNNNDDDDDSSFRPFPFYSPLHKDHWWWKKQKKKKKKKFSCSEDINDDDDCLWRKPFIQLSHFLFLHSACVCVCWIWPYHNLWSYANGMQTCVTMVITHWMV